MTGTVGNSAGPLGNVFVVAKDANGVALAETTTAADGTFTLTTLPPGTYTLLVFGNGYQPRQSAPFTVAGGQTLPLSPMALTPVGVSDTIVTTIEFDVYTVLVAGNQLTPGQLAKTEIPEAFVLDARDQMLLQGSYNSPACQKTLSVALNVQKRVENQLRNLSSRQSELAFSLGVANLGNTQIAKFLESMKKALARIGDLVDKEIGPIDTGFLVQVNPSTFLPGPKAIEQVAKSYFSLLEALGAQDESAYNTAKQVLQWQLDSIRDSTVILQAAFAKYAGLPTADLEKQIRTDSGSAKLKAVLKLIKPTNDPKVQLALLVFGEELRAAAAVPTEQIDRLQNAFNQLDIVFDRVKQFKAELKIYARTTISDFRAALTLLEACECNLVTAPPGPTAAATAFVSLQSAAPASGSMLPPITGCKRPGPAPSGGDAGGQSGTNVGGSVDPNDLIGPAGVGPQGFLQPATFPYRVDFENDPAVATAAAQIVTITLSLDSDLDPATFQFTGFGFGSRNYMVPAGLSRYETTLDLRPSGTNLLAPVSLDLNPVAGSPGTYRVEVSFASLDPLTRRAPDGVDDGFLPVDNAAGDGEGYFTFTVRPKAGLATGMAVTAQASIVFDTNAAIATPTVLNTIDATAPTSSVSALPATQTSPTFTVNWSGIDAGSGIAFYDVFVSDNGGPFAAFRTATTATSAAFTGVAGHTYAFYSVATDNVGLTQPTPTSAQATTAVSPPPPAARPELVGYPAFAVGTDAGLASPVQFYGETAADDFSLTAFGGFAGGVRTTAADLTGDGVSDLAVGTGVGAVAEVVVYDGVTRREVFRVQPFADVTGGVFVTGGDVTGDGIADLVVTPDQGGGPRVTVFRGGSFAVAANFFGIEDPNFRGGARAALGDVNADGVSDLVISAGFGGGPRIAIFDGRALGQSGQITHLVNDFFMFEDTLRNGAYVAAGDLDGDGYADVIGGGGPGGGPRVLVLGGKELVTQRGTAQVLANFFAGNIDNRGGIRVAAKNLDDDRFADLVVGDGVGGGSRVTGYFGTDFVGGVAPEGFSFDAYPGFTGGVFVG